MSTTAVQPNTPSFLKRMIQDMKDIHQNATHIHLNMGDFLSYDVGGHCYICAGGAAVLYQLDADKRDTNKWTDEQWQVAQWCDAVRVGEFNDYEDVWPVPESVQKAWHQDMTDYDQNDSVPFFKAWDNFVDQWEQYEKTKS